jgi:hypothetical protein
VTDTLSGLGGGHDDGDIDEELLGEICTGLGAVKRLVSEADEVVRIAHCCCMCRASTHFPSLCAPRDKKQRSVSLASGLLSCAMNRFFSGATPCAIEPDATRGSLPCAID